MATEIIDGVGPQNHVTSDQVGLAQEGTIGAGAIILPVGQQLGYDIVSNNQVNIKDGVYLIQGKRGWIRPGTVEQCTIDTGNNGQYRNDLICVKYTKNAQSKVEEFSVEVVKGTPGAAGTDPTYTTGDINDGALENYAPIYRVRLNGINIIGVDLVASKIDSLLDTAKKIGNLSELTTSAKTSLVAAANELKAAIGELNGNTSVENIPSQLTGYNGTAAVSKKGNQVIFSFDLGYGQRQEVGEQQTIFTIPEGYRPNRSLTKFWLTTDGSDTLGYFWRILPDGRITLQSQTSVVGKNVWMVDYFVWNI